MACTFLHSPEDDWNQLPVRNFSTFTDAFVSVFHLIMQSDWYNPQRPCSWPCHRLPPPFCSGKALRVRFHCRSVLRQFRSLRRCRTIVWFNYIESRVRERLSSIVDAFPVSLLFQRRSQKTVQTFSTQGWACSFYFVIVYGFIRYILQNLYLACLVSNYAMSSMEQLSRQRGQLRIDLTERVAEFSLEERVTTLHLCLVQPLPFEAEAVTFPSVLRSRRLSTLRATSQRSTNRSTRRPPKGR